MPRCAAGRRATAFVGAAPRGRASPAARRAGQRLGGGLYYRPRAREVERKQRRDGGVRWSRAVRTGGESGHTGGAARAVAVVCGRGAGRALRVVCGVVGKMKVLAEEVEVEGVGGGRGPDGDRSRLLGAMAGVNGSRRGGAAEP